MMEEALVQEPLAVALELEQRFHLFVASHRERARRWRGVWLEATTQPQRT